MADVKISALPAGTTPGGSDVFPMVQSSVTNKVTTNQLFTAPAMQSYVDFNAIADPSAPGTGVLRVYTKSVAGRMLPKWIGPSGLDTTFQAGLSQNSVTMWLPGTGNTAAINFGTSWTVGATQTHPTIAVTNIMTSIKRATFTTTTTAANVSGIRSAAPVAVNSTTTGIGGYFFAARFGILTYTSTMRVLVGLTATSGALAGDPSAQLNTNIMSKDTGETTWQWTTADGTTFEKTSSGRTTQAGGSTNVFDFYTFCKQGQIATVTGRFVDITDGTVLIDNVDHTTHVPANATVMYAAAQVMNVAGGGGSAVAIFLSKIYVECDN